MAYEVSIFLENKIGHLKRVTRVLKENGLNIRSMSINNTPNGWGILKMLVNDPHKAYESLSENGVSVALREVITLEMTDKSGGLDELLLEIAKAEINFDNIYSRILEEGKLAILILDVPDIDESKRKLQKAGIPIMDSRRVYGL